MTLEAAARKVSDLTSRIEWLQPDLEMAKRSGYPRATAEIEAHIVALERELSEARIEWERLRRAI